MEKPRVFQNLGEAPEGAEIVDQFSSLVAELFFILHPNIKKNTQEGKKKLEEFLAANTLQGIWLYFPWLHKVFHCLREDLYFTLRTARNRNIITKEEQQNYRNVSVGIAGLSVGSQILAALVRSGGPKMLKIADFDTLELSNLNRLQASFLEIGENKTEIAAKHSWEIDPFAQIEIWSSGITYDTMENFLLKNTRLDLFIDEMDDLRLKVHARTICKREGIPVLMATDNGDGVILDIERFDLEKNRPIFHGMIEGESVENREIDFATWLRLATKIVNPEFLTGRMQESLLEIGKSIAGIPQLGTTAAIAGSVVSFAVRRIANRQALPSGRYMISLEERLVPDYNTAKAKNARLEAAKKFITAFQNK